MFKRELVKKENLMKINRKEKFNEDLFEEREMNNVLILYLERIVNEILEKSEKEKEKME